MNGCRYEHADRQCHHPSVVPEENYVDWCVEGMCDLQEPDGEMMFLVSMHWINKDILLPIVITKTNEKALEYISKEMKDKRYNGTGYFEIKEIPLYE